MIAYVVKQYRTVSKRHTEWWVFFTDPLVYHVWWQPDGSQTMEEYLRSQTRLVQQHLQETNRA